MRELTFLSAASTFAMSHSAPPLVRASDITD